MISFQIVNKDVILKYDPDSGIQPTWLDEKLLSGDYHTFSRTFTVSKEIYFTKKINDGNDVVRYFKIGYLDKDYFYINKDVLSIKHNLLIDASLELTRRLFVAVKDISIFKRIDHIVDQQIIIGGIRMEAIPVNDFMNLVKIFPNTTELEKYAYARISREINEYFETTSDAEQKLIEYMNRNKKQVLKSSRNIIDNPRPIYELELKKHIYLKETFEAMLDDSESYTEKQWEEKVAEIFLLIYPQYIAILRDLSLREEYTHEAKKTLRKFDLVLVNANGNIDLIEIKKPFKDKLIAKKMERDNYIPHRELSTAVMQAEKYLFYINKAGRSIETDIEKKYKPQLPDGFKIRIGKPQAIILNGRDDNLDTRQRFDFSIIQRKYSNIVDILTYDDLHRRLENIIESLRRKA